MNLTKEDNQSIGVMLQTVFNPQEDDNATTSGILVRSDTLSSTLFVRVRYAGQSSLLNEILLQMKDDSVNMESASVGGKPKIRRQKLGKSPCALLLLFCANFSTELLVGTINTRKCNY